MFWSLAYLRAFWDGFGGPWKLAKSRLNWISGYPQNNWTAVFTNWTEPFINCSLWYFLTLWQCQKKLVAADSRARYQPTWSVAACLKHIFSSSKWRFLPPSWHIFFFSIPKTGQSGRVPLTTRNGLCLDRVNCLERKLVERSMVMQTMWLRIPFSFFLFLLGFAEVRELVPTYLVGRRLFET